MFSFIADTFFKLFRGIGMHVTFARLLTILIIISGLLLAWLILFYVLKKISQYTVHLLNKRKPTFWRTQLLSRKFFQRVMALIPTILIQKIIPQFFSPESKMEIFFLALINIGLVLNFMMIILSFLNAATDVLLLKEETKDKPMKSYFQVLKIIFWIITLILIVSILLNKSPAGLLAGIGAFSAVLLLVFQDTIVGFVNSVQLSSNDLVRNGDWITMSKFNADGNVEEINLTSVKVRNFDQTITTIPVRQMVQDSFQNWRGMQDKGIRQIKRAIRIDVSTIKPCNAEMLERFKEVELIKTYIEKQQQEIDIYNKKLETDTSLIPNGKHQTNIGIFRIYMEAYLKNNPHISKKDTLMVRQLTPNEYGLPVEIYCFTNTSDWIKYENIQSDIFDHIYSVLSFFEIKAYQRDAAKKEI
jgi:miniconductance mechanosensitive channel